MDEGARKRGVRDDSWDPGLGSGWDSFITVEKTGERNFAGQGGVVGLVEIISDNILHIYGLPLLHGIFLLSLE